MVDVDAMWTAVDINPFISSGWVLFCDTIPVFPHMMWGFFLSSICLLLNALQMICFRYTSVS